MKEHRRKKLRMKQAKIERQGSREGGDDSSDDVDSDEEDVELDGGFKIPSTIWKKLYRCEWL